MNLKGIISLNYKMEEKNLDWRKPIIITSASLRDYYRIYPTRHYKIVGSDIFGFLKQELEIEKRDNEFINIDHGEFPILENKLLEVNASHGLRLKEIKEKKAKIVLLRDIMESHIKTDNKLSLYRVTPVKEMGFDIIVDIYKNDNRKYNYDLNATNLFKGSSSGYNKKSIDEVIDSIVDMDLLNWNFAKEKETMLFLTSRRNNNKFKVEKSEISKVEKALFEAGYSVCSE